MSSNMLSISRRVVLLVSCSISTSRFCCFSRYFLLLSLRHAITPRKGLTAASGVLDGL